MIDKPDNITVLNTLTATLIDSVEGYRDAAQHTESGRFQEMFRQMANDRSTCVEDLRAEVRRLGGEAEDDQSTMTSVAIQPAIFALRGRTSLPIARGLPTISIIRTINGAASTPFITAAQ